MGEHDGGCIIAPSVKQLRADRPRYQILTLCSAGRTIGSPSLQPQASRNSFRFDIGPLMRQWLGECWSVRTDVRIEPSVETSCHTRAQPRKKRCSGVKPE